MAVTHCPGHQKKDTEVAKGNHLADPAMEEAADGTFTMPLVSALDLSPVLDLSQFVPDYLTADLEKAGNWGF